MSTFQIISSQISFVNKNINVYFYILIVPVILTLVGLFFSSYVDMSIGNVSITIFIFIIAIYYSYKAVVNIHRFIILGETPDNLNLNVKITLTYFCYSLLIIAVATMPLIVSILLPFLSGLGAIFLAIWIATMIPAFQQTSEAFIQRWDNAALSEAQDSDSAFSSAIGVFEKRIIGTFTAPFSNIDTVPILGGGIGIGTNVGSQRLSGDLDFLVGEGAVESTLFELGLPLGLAFIIWRIAFGFWMLQLA